MDGACEQGEEHPVIAIEPLLGNLLRLRSSLCANTAIAHRVTLIATALGVKDQQNCTLLSHDTNQGDGIMECEHVPIPGEGYRVRQQGIRVSQLDLLLQTVPKIGYIKMDIEGHENFALEGGRHTFLERKVPYIMLEYSVGLLAPRMLPDPPQTFLHKFSDAGYALALTGFNATENLTPEEVHIAALNVSREVFMTYHATS